MQINESYKHKGFLKISSEENFRDNQVLVSGKNNLLLPTNSTFINPYTYYEFITKQLISGTHKFRIDTINSSGNTNEGEEVSLVIPERVLPPRFLSASINGIQATISWSHSVDGPPDRYALFGTNMIFSEIDRNLEFNGISVDGNETSVTFNLHTPGFYRFTVDAKVGSILSNNFITVDITSPESSVVPAQIINSTNLDEIDVGQLSVFAKNVPIGKMNLQFMWLFGNQAQSFNLYHDSGTGVIDYGSPINFIRQNTLIQNFTTDQISFDTQDTLYKFVLRAVSDSGVEDSNDFENEVTLNGSIPDDAGSVTVNSCLC